MVSEPQRPGILPPLTVNTEDAGPSVPRRRVSNAWAENLEETSSSSEIKSPLQKMASFFTESKSSSPVQKEPKLQKQNTIEKQKTARRESIKDHLIKFKQKAGKVLEEVQERFTDDHSAVAPLVPSPTLQVEPVESDDPSGSERVVSPTISLASKKTTSSAELKASLRTKIRKQAEKVVERTRGSVQLTRRLQRRLTVHQEDTFTESDLKNEDEQIESSIKLGEKFLAQQPPSVFPPEDDQLLFFTQSFAQGDRGGINAVNSASATSKLIYAAAGPCPEEDPMVFTVYEPDANDIENRAVHPVNYRMRKRLPVSVWNDQLGTDMLISRKFKWPSPEDEAYTYLPALKWEDQMAAEEKKGLIQIQVVIDTVALVNHSLSTVEEGIASSLRHAFTEQQMLLDKGISLLQMGDEEKEQREPKWMERELTKLQQQLQIGLESLRQQSNALEAARAAQGYALTSLRYVSPADSSQMIGTLKEDSTESQPATTPANVKEKIQMKNKHSMKVCLYFNDVLVGKTSWRPLGNYNLHFSETFNMEVKTTPQRLHGVLVERIGRKEEEITKIEIPIPWEKHSFSEKKSIPFQEFNENKEGADTIRGFLVARVDWSPPEHVERAKENKSDHDVESVPFSLISPQCRLVSDEEFDGNLRWEVLEKRFNRKLPKSVDSRRIGIDSSEIDPALVVGVDERAAVSSSGGFRTGIDGHRIAGNGYAVRIRTKLLEQRSEAENQVAYEELVREVPLPTGIGAFGSLFGPPDDSRKLKPMRVESKRQQAGIQAGSRILVNIQSAMNLPARKDNTLQAFVEVRFQKANARSTVVTGRHSNWQQCLVLPLDVENIPDLKTIIDYLHIDVYDQVVTPLSRDDREPNSVHEQLLRRLIGTVRIPFSTIYCRGRIDGGFRIQTPLFITGYSIPDKPSYIKVLIALEPPIAAPGIPPALRNDTNEPDKIVSHCDIWLKSCKELFPERRFVALVNDINGKNVLVCRFLRPIRCPPALEHLNSRKSVATAAKVVSYMPFLADPLLFPGIIDLWTTIDQFVSFGCGDEEEHAVLLCCWLLGSRIMSYLVLGSAIPEGEKAAFVLAELPEATVLINPTDGNLYNLDDPMCPILSVGCVVTETNVYGNVQQRMHPSQMNFDFSKTSDWRPLFAKPLENVVSVQPSGVSYQDVTEDALVELRSSIEREIKIRFDEQRQFAIPQWNLMASRLLREMLSEDNWTQHTIDDRFGRLRDSYNVHATAIKIPYISLQNCVDEVLELGMHLNTDQNIQFALGVHVQPFFNNIVSCSLAMAVLSPKR